MKRSLFCIIVLLIVAVSAQAQMRFGVRGGLNVTKMSFDKDLIDAKNQSGFYIGPTLKFGAILFDVEASAIYSEQEVKTDVYRADASSGDPSKDSPLTIKRRSFAIPVNIRKGFGFGEKLDVFIFAGPQFDFGISGDTKFGNIKDDATGWTWKSSALSVNVGAGLTLLRHLEFRANYNFPVGSTGQFSWGGLSDKSHDAYDGKIGGWQVGAAIYF